MVNLTRKSQPIWEGWTYSYDDFINDSPMRGLHEKDFDSNDYQSLQDWSSDPLFGSYAKSKMSKLESEENERYWEDKAKRTGLNLEDVPYPIRSGLYGHYSGNDTLAATDSVIHLYDDLRRW